MPTLPLWGDPSGGETHTDQSRYRVAPASMDLRLKRLLRPWVYRLRRGRVRLRHLVFPLSAWTGQHDPILASYPPWRGMADGRFMYDFLGVRTDPLFRPFYVPQPKGDLITRYPTPDQ